MHLISKILHLPTFHFLDLIHSYFPCFLKLSAFKKKFKESVAPSLQSNNLYGTYEHNRGAVNIFIWLIYHDTQTHACAYALSIRVF